MGFNIEEILTIALSLALLLLIVFSFFKIEYGELFKDVVVAIVSGFIGVLSKSAIDMYREKKAIDEKVEEEVELIKSDDVA
jgi:hypothetical protein